MKTLISAAVITLALSGPAHATASGCAVVLRTPDGFLNVRAGPSMKAPVVGKFRPGDLIESTANRPTMKWLATATEGRGGAADENYRCRISRQ